MDEHIATITRCMDQVLAGREISREEAETLFAAGKEEPFFLMRQQTRSGRPSAVIRCAFAAM